MTKPKVKPIQWVEDKDIDMWISKGRKFTIAHSIGAKPYDAYFEGYKLGEYKYLRSAKDAANRYANRLRKILGGEL